MIRFSGLADYEISPDGRTIRCLPVPGIAHHTLEHLYRNQVQPLALNKDGKLVFHGSAIEIEDGAIAFLGASGRGKSTMAAAFAVRGHRFLTDDGLVIEPDGDGGFLALPSHPSIRLWADSQERLLHQAAPMAPALEYTSKGQFLSGEGLQFCDAAKPLRAAFFLGSGSVTTVSINRLSPAEAVMAWVEHSFLLDLEDHGLLEKNFKSVAEIIKSISCYRLDYPRAYEQLDQVVELVTSTLMHSTRSLLV